jgi:hypothetical protein
MGNVGAPSSYGPVVLHDASYDNGSAMSAVFCFVLFLVQERKRRGEVRDVVGETKNYQPVRKKRRKKKNTTAETKKDDCFALYYTYRRQRQWQMTNPVVVVVVLVVVQGPHLPLPTLVLEQQQAS